MDTAINPGLSFAQTQANDAAKARALMGRKVETKDEARQVAEEFEGIFLSTMLESMFAGVKTDGPFGGGNAEGAYRSMLNQEYAKAISRSGGIGIADQVYAEILRTQNVATPEMSTPEISTDEISTPAQTPDKARADKAQVQ